VATWLLQALLKLRLSLNQFHRKHDARADHF
jgi:hypothetical protein